MLFGKLVDIFLTLFNFTC